MKLSKYIYLIHNNEHTIALNTLYGNFVNIFDKKRQVYDVLSGELYYTYLTDEVQNFLFENNMLIQDDIDENNDLNKLIENTINNKSKMHLIILPTEDCNFRCIYCYENHEKKYMSGEIQNRLMDFILDRLQDVDSISIDWFGGEPLIAMNLIESISESIKKICLQHRIKFVASMTTNGYILTADMVRRLRKCNVFSYQITLDGFQQTHDQQRILSNGQGTWKKVIDNLLDIKNNYHSSMLEITVRVNLSREIYKNYKEFIDFLKDNFSDDKRFRYLFRMVMDYGNLDEEVKNTFITEKEYFEVLFYSLKQGLYNATIPNCISPGGMLCYAYKSSTYVIQPDGIISKCTLNLYNDINCIGSLSTGEYRTTNYFTNIIKKKNAKCKECVKYPICLKADCNMMTHEEMQCEPDMKNLDLILPYISDKRYGCIRYIPESDERII